MKPTDFSIHVTNFLTHYLAAQRNLSPNTIKAYRDVFTLLLRFCRDVRGLALERLSLAQIDVSLVEAFLDHLGNDRHCSIPTQKRSAAPKRHQAPAHHQADTTGSHHQHAVLRAVTSGCQVSTMGPAASWPPMST